MADAALTADGRARVLLGGTEPPAPRPGVWPGMERAHERGLARSIGVSNFDAAELDAVLAEASVPPVVNQVQFSPFKYRRALLEACEQRDIVLEAYSPLTTGRNLGDARLM